MPQLMGTSLGSPMQLRLLLLAALAGIVSPVGAQQLDTLTDADLTVSMVQIGSVRATILKLLGPPTTSSSHRLEYPGLAIMLDDHGKCDEMAVTGPHWATARGLRVGDSMPRIFSLYGEWAAARDSSLVLYQRSAAFESELGMQILVRSGKVIEIDVGGVIDHN